MSDFDELDPASVNQPTATRKECEMRLNELPKPGQQDPKQLQTDQELKFRRYSLAWLKTEKQK